MKNIIRIAKKNLHIIIFTAFAVLFALSFWYISPSGNDVLLAERASSDGFFSAVGYGTNELGEGIVTSFLCTLLAICPLFIGRVLSFVLCVVTLVLAARLPFPKRSDADDEEHRKNATALVFTAALFAVSGKSVLLGSVFSISGMVHYVLPTLLILVLVYLTMHSDENKGALYAVPALTVAIAMLSYQAAVAALVIAVFDFISVLRSKTFPALRVALCGTSIAILASCSALYLVQSAGFPEGVARSFILRNFIASVLGYGGFFIPILLFMLFTAVSSLTNDIIPAVKARTPISVSLILRVMLCLLSAATFVLLIPYSALITVVKIPGIMLIPRFLVTSCLAVAVLLIDMHCGADRLSARLVLAATAALFASAVTCTFGGAAYYIPMILALPVLAHLFARIQTKRAATVIAAGLGALYFAQNSVTPAHFISVAALLGAGAIIQASPLFRKRRIYETVVVLFVFVLFFMTNRWL